MQAVKLPCRRLGRSGLEVSALGLGGAGLGGVYGEVSDSEAIEAVRAAVEQGITYIDTDASYGDSERKIGLAFQEGGLREKVALSTKTGTHPDRRGDFSWDGTLWNVENSLRVLGTDWIDLALVHDPDDMAPVLAGRGALAALQDLKRQGVIKAVGLGQRNHEYHRQAIEAGLVDVILTYKDYNPIRTTALNWLLPLCEKHDIGVIDGSPLAGGLLTGEDPDRAARHSLHPEEGELEAARRFYAWCKKRGVPEQAVTLQFCLRQPLVHATLIGAKTKAEIVDDVQAASLALPDDLWDELAELNLPVNDG